MPWCPKCKNEYKDGYTVCADCGTELVASLEEGPVPVYFGEETLLNEIADFMHANGMKNTEVVFDEKENTYELFVSGKKEEAQKLTVPDKPQASSSNIVLKPKPSSGQMLSPHSVRNAQPRMGASATTK